MADQPTVDFQVVRRYGHLYEATQIIPTADKPLFKRRYIARRALADLAKCPEGFEFQHLLEDRSYRAVILLTPPHMVAVCNEHGQWKRRSRNEAVDGPQPYTREWFNTYLQKSQLPNWFLSVGHLDLLTNDAEAKAMGVVDSDLQIAREIPAGYLAARYPTPPQFPELIGVSPHQDYQYALNEEEQFRVARYFPATNVVGPNERVLLKPGGYIVVHHDIDGTGSPVLSQQQVRFTNSAASRASYLMTKVDSLPLHDILTPNIGNRGGIAAAKSSNGGFVNPTGHMAGMGAWEWLDANVDKSFAQLLGFQQPADVAVALSRGNLCSGRDSFAAPSVVWQPDQRYFNPAEEPEERGKWEFCNDESRKRAQEELGGQDAYGLAQFPEPIAAHVWQIRHYFKQTDSAHDPTAEIDLVWILAGGGEAAEAEVTYAESGVQFGIQIPIAATEETSATADDTPSVASGPAANAVPCEPDAGHGHDIRTGLAHDPRNGGENDQTATDGKADYHTRIIKGKKITMDRARAHAVTGNAEPQLQRLWAYTEGGKWQRYPETKEKIDWSNKDSVEKANRSRQQNCKRNNWEPKRTAVRKDYSAEQRTWIFDQVAANKGSRPVQRPGALCKEFNQKFADDRQPKAIEALVDRMAKEYRENGGKMKARAEKQPAKKKRKTLVKSKDTSGVEDQDTTVGDVSEQTAAEQTEVSTNGANDLVPVLKSSTKRKNEEDSDADAEHESDVDMD